MLEYDTAEIARARRNAFNIANKSCCRYTFQKSILIVSIHFLVVLEKKSFSLLTKHF